MDLGAVEAARNSEREKFEKWARQWWSEMDYDAFTEQYVTGKDLRLSRRDTVAGDAQTYAWRGWEARAAESSTQVVLLREQNAELVAALTVAGACKYSGEGLCTKCHETVRAILSKVKGQ